jgi:hypothetical protein
MRVSAPPGRSDVESIRVIVPGEGARPGRTRRAKSTGGRRGGLTEARARIRAITTPVLQLRLRESQSGGSNEEKQSLKPKLLYARCPGTIRFYLHAAAIRRFYGSFGEGDSGGSVCPRVRRSESLLRERFRSFVT